MQNVTMATNIQRLMRMCVHLHQLANIFRLCSHARNSLEINVGGGIFFFALTNTPKATQAKCKVLVNIDKNHTI